MFVSSFKQGVQEALLSQDLSPIDDDNTLVVLAHTLSGKIIRWTFRETAPIIMYLPYGCRKRQSGQ